MGEPIYTGLHQIDPEALTVPQNLPLQQLRLIYCNFHRPIERSFSIIPFSSLYVHSLLNLEANHISHDPLTLNTNGTTLLDWEIWRFNNEIEFQSRNIEKIDFPSIEIEGIVYLLNTIDLVKNYLSTCRMILSSSIDAPVEIIPKNELQSLKKEEPREIIKAPRKMQKSVNHGKILPDFVQEYIFNEICSPEVLKIESDIPQLTKIVRNFLLDKNNKNFPEGIVFSQSIFKRLEEGATLQEIEDLRVLGKKAAQNNIDTTPIWESGQHFFINSDPTAKSRCIRKPEIEGRKKQSESLKAANNVNTVVNNLEAQSVSSRNFITKLKKWAQNLGFRHIKG